MSFFSSKFFLLGVFLLLLVSIPVTIFFIKDQQEVRTKAAPTTTLSFSPSSKNATVGTSFDLDVMVDPGQNTISFVKLHIIFDASKLEAVQVKSNISAFPLTLDGPDIAAGVVKVSLGIGSDPTKAIQTVTKVASITFKPLATTTGPTTVSFDPNGNQVLSLSAEDQPGENVLRSTSPASVSIGAVGGVAPTSTPTPTSAVTPTGGATPTLAPGQPTPTKPAGGTANASPTCNSLTATPLKGNAPLTVSFTAKGSDSDGTITKATFNFGNGKQQDVTAASNQKTVELKASQTYQTAGAYSVTVTFTDNSNGVSLACSQSIEVTTAGGAVPTSTPGAAATPGSTTAAPTLEAPGSLTISLGILIGISIITTFGMFLLLF